VMFDKPGVVPLYRTLKLLTGLNQKVRGQVQGLQRSPAADGAPPAERPDLTRSVVSAERGKPVALPAVGVGRSQGRPTGWRVKEEGASEGRPVIGRIGVATLPPGKPGRLPSGVGGRERATNRRRKQSRTVGAAVRAVAGAASATDVISVAGTAVVPSRSSPRPMGRPRACSRCVGQCLSRMR
jgi:hypothetical protein